MTNTHKTLAISFALVAALCAVVRAAHACNEQSWQHRARLDPPKTTLPLGVGCAVAANDFGWIAVGAGQDLDIGGDSGSVSLWRMDGAESCAQGVIVHPRASTNSAFGSALDFDPQGTHLCVGAPNEAGARAWPENFEMGRVHLYRLAPCQHDPSSARTTAHGHTYWMLEASIESNAPLANAHFGAAVAVDGERMIIGSPSHSGRGVAVGRAEVFVHTANGWKFEQELVAPNGAMGMRFGTSVAIHTAQRGGDFALVGSPNFFGVGFSSGCADLFRRAHGVWQHVARFTAPQPQVGAVFGLSLALDDELIAIGAPQESVQASGASPPPPQHAGAVHLYTCAGGGECDPWIHTATLTSPQPSCGPDHLRAEAFGMSLAMARHRLVVGASEACASIATPDGARLSVGAGAAYIVERIAADQWRIEERLVAPTALEEVHDAYRVAVGSVHGAPFVVAGRLGNFDQPSPGEANVFALTAATHLVATSPASQTLDSASR